MTTYWLRFTQWLSGKEDKPAAWKPEAVKPVNTDMTHDQRRRLADEARQVLDNRHFKDAWNAVHGYLEAQALGCDPDEPEKARRIVISMQLLQAVRRELVRKMDDGYMAEVQINELEAQRKRRAFVR